MVSVSEGFANYSPQEFQVELTESPLEQEQPPSRTLTEAKVQRVAYSVFIGIGLISTGLWATAALATFQNPILFLASGYAAFASFWLAALFKRTLAQVEDYEDPLVQYEARREIANMSFSDIREKYTWRAEDTRYSMEAIDQFNLMPKVEVEEFRQLFHHYNSCYRNYLSDLSKTREVYENETTAIEQLKTRKTTQLKNAFYYQTMPLSQESAKAKMLEINKEYQEAMKLAGDKCDAHMKLLEEELQAQTVQCDSAFSRFRNREVK